MLHLLRVRGDEALELSCGLAGRVISQGYHEFYFSVNIETQILSPSKAEI